MDDALKALAWEQSARKAYEELGLANANLALARLQLERAGAELAELKMRMADKAREARQSVQGQE
jgi:hypothetical protein